MTGTDFDRFSVAIDAKRRDILFLQLQPAPAWLCRNIVRPQPRARWRGPGFAQPQRSLCPDWDGVRSAEAQCFNPRLTGGGRGVNTP